MYLHSKQPQARLLDLLLAHPALDMLITFDRSRLSVHFTPRLLTLHLLPPPGGRGAKVELGQCERSKGEGEEVVLARLLGVLRYASV
jgi:hypothetical protein